MADKIGEKTTKTVLDGQALPLVIAEKDAAKILGISNITLKRIRYAKEIDFFRIGNQVFYSLQMLEVFLNKCRRGGV